MFLPTYLAPQPKFYAPYFQVIHDLLEYNVHAQLPYFHTWWHNGPLWEESVFFNAPTVGMDTNTTAHVGSTTNNLTP